jgi:hypothetical protein
VPKMQRHIHSKARRYPLAIKLDQYPCTRAEGRSSTWQMASSEVAGAVREGERVLF